MLDGIMHIEESVKIFAEVSEKMKTWNANSRNIKKERNNLTLIFSELKEISNMHLVILIAEGIISDPKENESALWVDMLEWKFSLLEELDTKIRTALAQCLSDLKDLKHDHSIMK